MQERTERIENPLFTPPTHPIRNLAREKRIAELQAEGGKELQRLMHKWLEEDSEEQSRALEIIFKGLGEEETYRRYFSGNDSNS